MGDFVKVDDVALELSTLLDELSAVHCKKVKRPTKRSIKSPVSYNEILKSNFPSAPKESIIPIDLNYIDAISGQCFYHIEKSEDSSGSRVPLNMEDIEMLSGFPGSSPRRKKSIIEIVKKSYFGEALDKLLSGLTRAEEVHEVQVEKNESDEPDVKMLEEVEVYKPEIKQLKETKAEEPIVKNDDTPKVEVEQLKPEEVHKEVEVIRYVPPPTNFEDYEQEEETLVCALSPCCCLSQIKIPLSSVQRRSLKSDPYIGYTDFEDTDKESGTESETSSDSKKSSETSESLQGTDLGKSSRASLSSESSIEAEKASSFVSFIVQKARKSVEEQLAQEELDKLQDSLDRQLSLQDEQKEEQESIMERVDSTPVHKSISHETALYENVSTKDNDHEKKKRKRSKFFRFFTQKYKKKI